MTTAFLLAGASLATAFACFVLLASLATPTSTATIRGLYFGIAVGVLAVAIQVGIAQIVAPNLLTVSGLGLVGGFMTGIDEGRHVRWLWPVVTIAGAASSFGPLLSILLLLAMSRSAAPWSEKMRLLGDADSLATPLAFAVAAMFIVLFLTMSVGSVIGRTTRRGIA